MAPIAMRKNPSLHSRPLQVDPGSASRSAPAVRHAALGLSAWGLALVLAVLLAGCASRPTPAPVDLSSLEAIPLAGDESLRVVATTSLVGDVVGRVGGDQVMLTTLIALGADPHTYVATPSDSAAVHDAHVLFANGVGLEEGMSEMAADTSNGVIEVRLADTLPLLTLAPGDQAQPATEVDPHVWMDVQNVIAWTETVRHVLSALDPARASSYQANADAYRAELQALDAWIVGEIAAVPQDKRRLVTNHETLGYFARRYGFELVGAVYPLSPSAEPSAQDLVALMQAIRTYSLRFLFTEGTVSPVLAAQVARDTGVRLVPLYTESLGPVGSGAETYVGLMRTDVQAIVSALGE